MPDFTHFIRLTPHDTFFFGGENYSDEDERAFYFQLSRDFPQQTSMLGFLRYQLLKQNGYLKYEQSGEKIQDSHEAALLIGSHSFNPEDAGIQFGSIEHLSSVFLCDSEGNKYLPYPRVKQWGAREMEYHLPVFSSSEKGKAFLMGNTKLETLPDLQNYNPKTDMEWGVKDLEKDGYLNYDAVFETDMEEQVGIYKAHTLKYRRDKKLSERQGFFKLKYRKLKKGWGFGCLVNLSLNNVIFESQPMVIWGKERSAFRMEVNKLTDKSNHPFINTIPDIKGGETLWATGNAKVDLTALYPYCSSVITQEESFRCMITEVKKDFNYYGNPRMKNQQGAKQLQPGLSDRYNLLKRGSLIQLKENLSEAEIAIIEDILKQEPFQTIGYNYFLEV